MRFGCKQVDVGGYSPRRYGFTTDSQGRNVNNEFWLISDDDFRFGLSMYKNYGKYDVVLAGLVGQ